MTLSTMDHQYMVAKRRRVAIAQGTWRYRVPAEPAMRHIANLRAQGMSAAAISAASGVALSIISPLAWPAAKRARTWLLPATSDAILAVTADQAPDWALIPSIGTIRRIEALQCMGWSQAEIGRRMGGVTAQAISQTKRSATIAAGRARAFRELYDELSMTPGPDAKTRAWAAKKGYAPPLAWDDIDDPDSTPDVGEPAHGADLDEWVFLVHGGVDPVQAAARCGLRLRSVERAALRSERQDIVAMVSTARLRSAS